MGGVEASGGFIASESEGGRGGRQAGGGSASASGEFQVK